MKLYVRCLDDGRYVGKDSQFVYDEEDARDFATLAVAEQYCRDCAIHGAVIARFGEFTYDLSLRAPSRTS